MNKLEAVDICKSYQGEMVLSHLNLSLSQGETVAIVGESGVGKSTLLRILAGLEQADKGKLILNGEDVLGRAGFLGYMPQRDMLFPYYSVLYNTALPMILRGEDKAKSLEKANSYFSAFGIDGTQKKYPNQLSGGMRQRAAFLRTYLMDCEMALLDEPFSALDALTKKRMYAWFLDIMSEIHMATLFITHDIEEALLLADRIYIMAKIPAEITEEIVVHRNKKDLSFAYEKEFLEYKKHILEIFS